MGEHHEGSGGIKLVPLQESTEKTFLSGCHWAFRKQEEISLFIVQFSRSVLTILFRVR